MPKLRMALAGGGTGAFIGAVHRLAAELDGEIELVCGVFSSDADRSRAAGPALYGLPASRCYGSVAELLRAEAVRDPADRMHFLTVATPNDSHFALASATIAAGFDVVCDKPMTLDVAQARALAQQVRASDRVFALTHNYTGYPMVKEARRLVREDALGPVRRVCVEYLQGWLAQNIEQQGQKQADWRTDPARSGAAGCMGDIGTHAENLVDYVTDLRIESLCADLSTFVPGRRLDDDGSVLLRFAGGARGTLVASQVALGEANNLRLRIYGERGAIDWSQQSSNTLTVHLADGRTEVRSTGGAGVGNAAAAATRLPGGHPEGFLEAFANIYRGVAEAIRARDGVIATAQTHDYPSVDDGVRGMLFIDTVVQSSQRGGVWLPMPSA